MLAETLGVKHLGLFVVSGLLLNLTPGQDTLYILGRTLSQGRSAGLMSALGISAGSLVHTLLAAFGLSAILASSPTAFHFVKYAGAAYLIWLGVRMIVDADAGSGDIAAFTRERSSAIFRSGLLTNVLNPKVALFFMAFLPQFVAPAAESRIVALLFLGLVFVVNGLAWCCVLVWGASALSERVRAQPASGTWLKRVTGIVFIGLGVRLAVSR
jgi:RhtB (resistance to homoserine/threonine) family protein